MFCLFGMHQGDQGIYIFPLDNSDFCLGCIKGTKGDTFHLENQCVCVCVCVCLLRVHQGDQRWLQGAAI